MDISGGIGALKGKACEALQLAWEKGSAVDAPFLFIATVEAVHCDENGNIKWRDIPLL